MTDGVVQLKHDGPTLRVILNRPAVHNAVNREMCDELLDAFAAVEDRDDVLVVLISGRGSSFCAGADLKERHGQDAAWMKVRRRLGLATYQAVANCSKPVVAVVDGNVFGSGGEIALASDFIVGSSRTRFRFPEPHWGTVGATQRLQRRVGVALAKDLLFTNRLLEAAEAYRVGLLTRMVEPEELEREAEVIAANIAKASPLAVRLTKHAIDLGSETDLNRGIRIEMAAIEHNLAVGDWAGGIDRFNAGARHGDGA